MKKFIMLLFVILILVPLHGNKTELTNILSDLEQGIKQLQKKEYKPAPGMNVMAESLGTLEKIFEFVRDEIRFEGYAGKLRGPEGTFLGRAGNSIDQSELLGSMLGKIGLECRYVRGKLDMQHVGLLIEMGDSSPRERDSLFGAEPTPSSSRKDLTAMIANHCWIQVKQGNDWIDLDPCFPDHRPGQPACRMQQTLTTIPRQFVHRVKLDIKYRVFSAGRKRTVPMLTKEFPIANLYGKPLTLVSLIKGSSTNGSFTLDEVQPVLKLGENFFPGSVFTKSGLRKSEGRIAEKAAGKLSGIFDNLDSPPKKLKTDKTPDNDFIIESKWVDVTLFSPGKPADRFRYTIFDEEQDNLDTERCVRHLEQSIAFGFSPALLNRDAYQKQLNILAETIKPFPAAVRMIMNISRNADLLLKSPLSKPVKEFNLLSVEAERALSWMIVQTHLFHSDSAMVRASRLSGIASYFDGPRAVIASIGHTEGKTVFDLDLRRNQCRFTVPSGRPGGWEKNLNFVRGLYESRLEGAVLKSFTGKVGMTTGDVFQTAFEQNIPMRWITRSNRNDLQSLKLDRETKARIIRAVNSGHRVFLPEKPVRIAGNTVMAWYELNEATGFLDGVFSTGKHQSMVEKVQIHMIGCIVNSAKGYFFSMEVGFVFGITAGLNHFLNCVMANPAASCMGSAEVCKPAIRDAKAMCQAWGFYSGAAQFNPLPLIGLPDLLTLTYKDPCEKGAVLGLALFGCF